MRLRQLDSLRGLAACTVVVCHATNLLPGVHDEPARLWWLSESPLSLVRAGYAAVVFFFILSGYVLALPFLKGPVSYPAFVVRRICRIWIPYAAAMVVAIACAMWFHPNPVSGLSTWANRPIAFPSPRLMLNYFLLVGHFPNGTYDPVVWSLVYELRISLVFPLLVLLLRLGPWWRVLGAAVGLSVAELGVERLPFWGGSVEVPMTLHYAGLFVLGMWLARDMPLLQARYARCSARTKAWLWLVALVCYAHAEWIFPDCRLQRIPLYRDGLAAGGAALLIIFGLSPSRFSRWLGSKGLLFLGKISYSVYLYHAVILLSLVHCFWGRVPLGVLWLGTVALTLLVATLSYALIELPAIRLGKLAPLEPRLSATGDRIPATG
jgi:peptidoglycan/LPS O-acetylase OafA/YrhL